MRPFLHRLAAAALTGFALLSSAAAQTDFPQRPVTIVVPFPAGGSMDALGRMVSTQLAAKWGQPVIVDNRAGAGGLIGAERVKAMPPDGYNLLLTNSALIQVVAAPAPGASVPYDPIRDFQPVMHMTNAPIVFAVDARLPVKTLPEFIDLVKKEPRKHSFGSGGVNQTLHLLGAVFNQAAGLDMAHAPYKGEAGIVTDLVAGHISSSFITIAGARAQIETGKLRPLAVTGARSPLLPGVPSFGELGFPQLDVVGWFGMFAPAGTPKPVVDKLARDIAAVLKTPDIDAKLKELSLVPTALGPEEFGRIVQRDLGYWEQVVRKVGER